MPSPVQPRAHFATALYDLTVSDGEFRTVASATPAPFDPKHYSQFKYGRRDIAERYGAVMATLLNAHFVRILGSGEQIVVIGTPCKRLPNAARMLAIAVERRLRIAGLPTSYSYIYQHRLAEGDYGTLPQADRDQRNRQKQRYLDADDFAGKHVVVVDDIRITGAAQRASAAYLEPLMPASIWYLQAASLPEEVGRRHPSLENDLNSTIPPVLVEIAAYARGGALQLNTRLLRFILECENEEEFWNFMEISSLTFLREIHQAGVGSGQVYYEKYRRNLEAIFDYLHQFGRKPVS